MSRRIDKANEILNGKKQTSLHVVVLLDESGSMSSCIDQTIKGFNDYIDTLKKEKKNINITLTKFGGNRINVVCKKQSVNEVKPLTTMSYTPSGCTPLYDAIGKTINQDKKGKKTLFVIITDGEENASMEYNRMTVFKLIKDQENFGWTFVYLGADQDAWANSEKLGLSVGNTMSYNSSDTKKMYGSLALATSNFSLSMDRKPTKKFFRENWK